VLLLLSSYILQYMPFSLKLKPKYIENENVAGLPQKPAGFDAYSCLEKLGELLIAGRPRYEKLAQLLAFPAFVLI
jgi:hypothetical protein